MHHLKIAGCRYKTNDEALLPFLMYSTHIVGTCKVGAARAVHAERERCGDWKASLQG